MSEARAAEINTHYGRSDFGDDILAWLRSQGKDLDALTVEDLTPVDQFHGGRLTATRGLAELAQVSPTTRVADLGGGIGGPARYLAATFGCSVDVVDLTAEFCRVGTMLTGRVGLGEKVHFYPASAAASGLAGGAYDLVWMQNAAMNIEDRPALYREVRRLLRPGGCYVFQEVLAGDGGPAYYPANWASSAAESFLHSPESLLRLLLDAGFRVLRWEDETDASRETLRQQWAAAIEGRAAPSYNRPEKFARPPSTSAAAATKTAFATGGGCFRGCRFVANGHCALAGLVRKTAVHSRHLRNER